MGINFSKMRLPPEIITFLSALIPLADIKLAIPLGTRLGLSLLTSFFFAMAGSISFAALALALLGPITNYLRKKSKIIDKFCKTLFSKTRKQHSKKFQRYGSFFVLLFVAIPIPGSGVFNGSLIAFLFGVDYWKSLALVSLGVFIAGILVMAGYGSTAALIRLFA